MDVLTVCNEDLKNNVSEASLYFLAGMERKANDLVCEYVFGLCEQLKISVVGLSGHFRCGRMKETVETESLPVTTCLDECPIGTEVISITEYRGEVPALLLEKMAKVQDKTRLYILAPTNNLDPWLIYKLPVKHYRYNACRANVVNVGVVLAKWGDEE